MNLARHLQDAERAEELGDDHHRTRGAFQPEQRVERLHQKVAAQIADQPPFITEHGLEERPLREFCLHRIACKVAEQIGQRRKIGHQQRDRHGEAYK